MSSLPTYLPKVPAVYYLSLKILLDLSYVLSTFICVIVSSICFQVMSYNVRTDVLHKEVINWSRHAVGAYKQANKINVSLSRHKLQLVEFITVMNSNPRAPAAGRSS